MTDRPSPAEMAYAILWGITEDDYSEAARQARMTLLGAIGKDGQRRGIAWLKRGEAPLPRLGIDELTRLAIACGNEPYGDAMVCPACQGNGYRMGMEGPTMDACLRCEGEGIEWR